MNASIIGYNSFGPKEQFTPMTSAPKPSNVLITISGVEPVRVLPDLSNVIVINTGLSLFSFTASKAALASYKSVKVSNIYPSTKSFEYKTTSLNASYASSNDKLPIGFSIAPVGPISNITILLVLLAFSIAFSHNNLIS